MDIANERNVKKAAMLTSLWTEQIADTLIIDIIYNTRQTTQI